MKALSPFYSIGHFINQPTNPTEFEIMRFEKMEEPDVYEVYKHSFYEILWTDKGVSDYGMREIHIEIPHTKSLLFIGQNKSN